ncbi:AraC family transcriptional regulator [Alcanivorax sp. NBRC 102024]|uniref:helix-turn-helix domain-containing protein n=1 Tax=Alcanivorax sp. NBRC 102024 TaxID=1113895 RepID=UPI000789E36C|nr:AraC family transcriptional regulator [Alcanivorax sp. NBRC 102024]
MAVSAGFKVSIEIVKKLLDLGRQYGVDVDGLLKEYDFRIQPIKGDPAYMPAEDVEFMLSVGLRQMSDPLPGLTLGLASQQQLFGLVAFLAQTSSTVGACLEKIMQLEPLISNTGKTRLEYSPGEAQLIWHCHLQDPFVRTHVGSFILFTYTQLINTGTQAGHLVHEVHMAHPAPKDRATLDVYRNAFNCPVIFNARHYRVLFPATAVDLSVNTADPMLNTVLTEHAQKLLEERAKPASFTDEVRLHIQKLLQDGNVSRENVAAMLNITSRTLHRKLRQEGTSYGDLLSRLRLERSCDLLRQSAQSVQAIARDAGFDEAHSFTRWFRQMTGLSPSEYRQKGPDPE